MSDVNLASDIFGNLTEADPNTVLAVTVTAPVYPSVGLAGVSVLSVAYAATWTLKTGVADPNYPVQNLADLIALTKVARVTPAAGNVAMSFVLASTNPIVQFVGVIAGNSPFIAATEIRLRLFSDTNPDPVGNAGNIVFDSAQTAMWPNVPVSGFRPTRPFVLPAAVAARSGLLEFFTVQAGFELAGVEIAQFWEWAISPNADFGISTAMQDQPIVGGGADTTDTFTPRIANGQIDYLKLADSASLALDFQKTTGRKQPFVFVQNYNDPTTWPRWCFLARNSDLPPMVGALYRSDRFQFRLTEHTR